MPVTVKENIATAGSPTPLGTAAAELVPATADAPVVARLREAGAVVDRDHMSLPPQPLQ